MAKLNKTNSETIKNQQKYLKKTLMPKQPTIIDAFNHCPCCGSAEFPLTNPFQRNCTQCGHQHHFNPVCAVGAIISDAVGNILLIERGNEPAKGKLGVPGGFTEPWESVETALHREVEEEIGLKLLDLSYLISHPNDYLFRGIRVPTIDFFFAAKTPNFDVIMQAGEISSWHLMPYSAIDMDTIAFESMRVALRLYASTPQPKRV